jgi:predicted nucleotide-binding protein
VAQINQKLLAKIRKRLNVAKATAYAIIQKTARQHNLPTNVAALVVARDAGIAITRFASDNDWSLIRGISATTAVSATSPTTGTLQVAPRPNHKKRSRTQNKPKGNKVWVVYGRNERIRKALFDFLRSLGLNPIEWNSALASTKKGSPHIAEVLDAGFKNAIATVILFTPDDEAKLKDEFISRNDPRYERKLMGQPRPNVLFEAGMAFGRHPEHTILVEVGKIKTISDLTGRHVVRLTGSFESRHQLLVKLRAINCPVG